MSCREPEISWEEYFMSSAVLASKRSKDPSTQVGACIIKDNRILSVGYNGSPNGMNDDDMKWGREGNFCDTKYAYVVHAEPNAIFNYKGHVQDLKGSTIYVTLFPCNECAKLIIQSGIKEVVYLSDKYHDEDNAVVARYLFDTNNVKYRDFNQNKKENDIHRKIEIEL